MDTILTSLEYFSTVTVQWQWWYIVKRRNYSMTYRLWLCGGVVSQNGRAVIDWQVTPEVLPPCSWAAVPGAGARTAPAPPAPGNALQWWLWQLPVALWWQLPVTQLPVTPPAGDERLRVPSQEPRVCPGGPGLPVHTDVWRRAAGVGEYSLTQEVMSLPCMV